jgi:hypothetical protein
MGTATLEQTYLPIWFRSTAGLAPAGIETLTIGLHRYMNGDIRGTVHQDVAGAFIIEMGDTQGVFDTYFNVPQDLTMPNFQYPFNIVIIQPFVRFTFTNGGAPSTYFRASVRALPI